MFGYVNINKSELKMKDYYKYKAYYCGLCKTLKAKYGYLGQMTLSYDMTFLIILLTSLYESSTTREQNRCIIHPVKKHITLCNNITEYVADMNIALTYYHFMDDWDDEKSILGLAGARALKKDYNKINVRYPRQCNIIKESINRLRECEIRKESNIDIVARCFGELMSEIFVLEQDLWEQNLRKVGFFLGKFIYILDAYDDIEKDIKKGNYNPLILSYNEPAFEEDCQMMLTMMMVEATKEFEKLPCLIDIDILQNILYEGVWTKLEKIKLQQTKRKEHNNDNKSI